MSLTAATTGTLTAATACHLPQVQFGHAPVGELSPLRHTQRLSFSSSSPPKQPAAEPPVLAPLCTGPADSGMRNVSIVEVCLGIFNVGTCPDDIILCDVIFAVILASSPDIRIFV